MLEDDSKPFVVLRESSENLISALEEDIKQCKDLLHSKLTALMLDPESLTAKSGTKLSTHHEFSKAKYEIFTNVKSCMEEMESDWVEMIQEMKKNFLESVEILLAGTKLEVKLPSNELSSRTGSPRGTRNQKDKSPSMTSSSLYPALINTAKHIPVLNSFFPSSEEESEVQAESKIATPLRTANKLKRVTINTTPTIKEFSNNSIISRKGQQSPPEEDFSEDEDEEEEEILEPEPVRRGGRLVKPTKQMTPVKSSLKKVESKRGKINKTKNDQDEEDDQNDLIQEDESVEEIVAVRGRRRAVAGNTAMQITPVKSSLKKRSVQASNGDITAMEEMDKSPLKVTAKTRRSGRSGLANETEKVQTPTPGRKSKTTKRKNSPELEEPVHADSLFEEDVEMADYESNEDLNKSSLSLKNEQYSLGMDLEDDLDIFSDKPLKMTRPTPRRKTVLIPPPDNFPDFDFTPDVARGKSKRKTIAVTVADVEVAPSPKRLKKGRNSLANSGLESNLEVLEETNLLDGDGATHYSSWVSLSDIGGNVPAQPGIYELKVSAAKKPAYIGGCESLRQKLTLHKLAHNSGHKHLDKFIERNKANILVRYEPLSPGVNFKTEEKNRVKAFVDQFKNSPAYN